MNNPTQVTVAPKGMGLNDFVAQQEGFFSAEGLDVSFDWKTFRGTQSSWKELAYFEPPRDHPYTEGATSFRAPARGEASATRAPAWDGSCRKPMGIPPGPSSCGSILTFANPKICEMCPSRWACAPPATSTCPTGWRNICRSRTSRS